MLREIEIHKLVPVIIEPDQIGLDIEAALNENDEDENEGHGVVFAVRNAVFEVRIGLKKVYEGKSDEATGAFIAKNIPVGEFGQNIEVELQASNYDGSASKKVQVNAESLTTEIDNRRREAEFREKRPREFQLINADKERQLKALVQKAFRDLDSDNGSIAEGALKILVGNHLHPFVQREIHNAARQHPHQFIQNSKIFYEASWAEAVLKELAHLEPHAIIGKVTEYFIHKWAENIVAQIAEVHPSLAFSEIEDYEHMPWAEGIAMNAAKLDPKSGINNFHKYRDRSWAQGVFDFARQIYEDLGRRIDATCLLFSQPHSNEDEINAFKFFVENQHDDRLENALSVLVEYFPYIFQWHYNYWENAVWGGKINKILQDKLLAINSERDLEMRRRADQLAEAQRVEALRVQAQYEETGRRIDEACQILSQPRKEEKVARPSFRRAIGREMEADKINAFKLLVDNQHDSRIADALSALAVNIPEVFHNYFPVYKEAAWGQRVIAIAGSLIVLKTVGRYRQMLSEPHKEEDEVRAFEFFKAFSHNDRMESTLIEMALESPEIFVKHHGLYKQALWGRTVFNVAQGKIDEKRAEIGQKIDAAYEHLSSPDRNKADDVTHLSFLKEQQHDERVDSALIKLVKQNKQFFWDHFHSGGEIFWSDKVIGALEKSNSHSQLREIARHMKTLSLWRKHAKAYPFNTFSQILMNHQHEVWAKYMIEWMSKDHPEGLVTKKFVKELGVEVSIDTGSLIKLNWAQNLLKEVLVYIFKQ